MVYLEHPSPCPYLKDQFCSNALLNFEEMQEHFGTEFFEALLERGFRHFGTHFYRPQCSDCFACKGLALSVDEFRPNRSQKRNLQTNSDLEINLRPSVDLDWDEHVELADHFHSSRAMSHEWPEQKWNEQFLHSQFAGFSCSYTLELRTSDGKLCGSTHLDLLPNAQNHIYAYHDPALSARGLGIFMILQGIEIARAAGRKHLYLGTWNPKCPSLAYKASFKPHFLIDERF